MTDEEYRELISNTRKKGKTPNPFFTKKNLLIVGGVAAFLAVFGTSVLIANRSNSHAPAPATTQVTNRAVALTITPTGGPVTVHGELVCLPDQPAVAGCPNAIKTTNGVYVLTNLQQQAISSKKYAVGQSVDITGIFGTTEKAPNETTSDIIPKLVINTISSSGQSNSQPNSKPTPTSGAIVAFSVTLTPTPIPPTPTPSHPPGNVTNIVDNQDTLNGQTITVRGYLVYATVGAEACTYLGLCDHSTFIVADSPSLTRDTSKDVTVIASETEKEENYITGEWLQFQAKVTVDNGVVTLEKVY